jgi:hypothetical protein
MKRTLAVVIGLSIAATLWALPANASKCSDSDTESVRSLFVPVIRLSAHQGRNIDENHEVVSSIGKIAKSLTSPKLRKSLRALKDVIKEGELNQGSTDYWGYREGSAWKTYKSALTLTQKNQC